MIEVETNHGLPLCRRTVRKGKAAVLLLAFLLCSLNGIAQTPTPSPSLSPQELQVPAIAPEFHPAEKPLPELGRVGVDMDRQRPLTLREALALALENNKDIEVARHNVKIAEFDLTAARGVYDPRLSSSSYYERIESPISSFLSGGSNGTTTQSDYTATARLEGLTPKLGGNYHLDFSSIKLTTNNQFAALNPQYPTALTFSYMQPLFRGLKFDNNRRQIEIAKKNLKDLIAVNRQADLWSLSIVPTDSVDLAAPDVSLPDALKAALENRPELQQSHVVREINQIDQKYFREQTKPAIDLVGSYGMVGLAGASSGAANPITASSSQLRDAVNRLLINAGFDRLPDPPAQTISPFLLGGYDQSLQNLLSNRFNNFRVGVQINLPLRNRTAEAQLGRSLVEGQRIATQREQLEQSVQVDVRNALQVVRSAEARLRSAVIARQASEQQYQSEQRKLDAGQSTVFLVLERQTALTTARGNELRAQTDLNKAIAELQRATGNALTSNNIVVRVR